MPSDVGENASASETGHTKDNYPMQQLSQPKQICFPYKLCMAPMVGQSDLAFRLLCLRHGASVVYTEMLYSDRIVNESGYMKESLQSTPEDRPLIVQVCGNDPDIMGAAAAAVEKYCNSELYGVDAIDINLGCPQKRAQEQLFGSYLLDKRHWPRVEAVVAQMNNAVAVPITCKIRLLQTTAQTVEFAQRLERAGASLLAVHGRQRGSQRHGRRGPADLAAVAAVKAAVSIPVVANGNVRCPADVVRNLRDFAVDGLMSAEGLLANPAIFEQALRSQQGLPELPNATRSVGLEYLALAEELGTPLEVQRQHVAHMVGTSAATAKASWQLRKQAALAARPAPPAPAVSSMRISERGVEDPSGGGADEVEAEAKEEGRAAEKREQGGREGEETREPETERRGGGEIEEGESEGGGAGGGLRRLREVKEAVAAAASSGELAALLRQLLPAQD